MTYIKDYLATKMYRCMPNTSIQTEFGILKVRYKIGIKKLIEFYRIKNMESRRLVKNVIEETIKIGGTNRH